MRVFLTAISPYLNKYHKITQYALYLSIVLTLGDERHL